MSALTPAGRGPASLEVPVQLDKSVKVALENALAHRTGCTGLGRARVRDGDGCRTTHTTGNGNGAGTRRRALDIDIGGLGDDRGSVGRSRATSMGAWEDRSAERAAQAEATQQTSTTVIGRGTRGYGFGPGRAKAAGMCTGWEHAGRRLAVVVISNGARSRNRRRASKEATGCLGGRAREEEAHNGARGHAGMRLNFDSGRRTSRRAAWSFSHICRRLARLGARACTAAGDVHRGGRWGRRHCC